VIEAKNGEWNAIWEIYDLYCKERIKIEQERIKKMKNELLEKLKEDLKRR
jgi:hypothetical protein